MVSTENKNSQLMNIDPYKSPKSELECFSPSADQRMSANAALLRIYFSPRGRISRKFLTLYVALPILVLSWLLFFFADLFPGEIGRIFLIALFFVPISIWVSTVTLIKRLHDFDKSGWFALLAMLPYVGFIFYLVMLITPGTIGDNRYGPDPKGR